MSSDPHARQPAGTPAGGQFAATAKTEPDVALGPGALSPLAVGTDLRTKTYGFHGVVTAVHSGCPMGGAQVMGQEVGIRPEALEPGYPWYTVTMHGGRGAAYVPHYDIVPTDSRQVANRELTEALDSMSKARAVVAKATTHLIAAELLKAEPRAAYLQLDDEATEYGTRVRTGKVLDADEQVLHDRVEDIELPDDVAPGHLYDQLSDLVSAYDDTNHALTCDAAVNDPMAREDGKLLPYRQPRIDLRAAMALYPEGKLS